MGFAGLEGSGKDAAIESLFGLCHVSDGDIRVDGNTVAIDSPKVAFSNGIALLPKHRESQAVIHNQSVLLNTLISSYSRFCNGLGFIKSDRARTAVKRKFDQLHVKTPSLTTLIDNLSGGNKQKVLVNRLALTAPKIVLLNEPTRGVDISAKPGLLKVIREQIADQCAVIMISESEDELIAVCDRILIFYQGRVSWILERGQPDFNIGEVYRQIQGVQKA